VRGVDSTGKGVVCDETIAIFLGMGSDRKQAVEINALIVPGLPERIRTETNRLAASVWQEQG
jgi:hypothetical protein